MEETLKCTEILANFGIALIANQRPGLRTTFYCCFSLWATENSIQNLQQNASFRSIHINITLFLFLQTFLSGHAHQAQILFPPSIILIALFAPKYLWVALGGISGQAAHVHLSADQSFLSEADSRELPGCLFQSETLEVGNVDTLASYLAMWWPQMTWILVLA